MRTLTLVLLMVLCAPAIPVRNAVAQEQQPALAELQRLDRALAKICEARKDRLDDRERDMWKRRRELVDSLDERQRDALKRTSPLDENCLQLIARLAEPSRPSYSPPSQGSQSGYSWRRHGYPYGGGGGGGGSPRARMAPPSAETPMAPQAAPQAPEARTGQPSSPQATIRFADRAPAKDCSAGLAPGKDRSAAGAAAYKRSRTGIRRCPAEGLVPLAAADAVHAAHALARCQSRFSSCGNSGGRWLAGWNGF